MRGSKQDLPVVYEAGEMSSRQAEWGEMNVAIETAPSGANPTTLFKGLPDDRCQCPHWGYVVKGRMTLRFPDREETYAAGDAFYNPPGHVPIKHEPGTEIVQFSPTAELRETEAAMQRNMKAMQGG
jgi:hypothetical protein